MDRANRIEIFKSMMQCLDDPEIPEKLEEWGFFDAPASTKYHGNYKGGLFDHSFAVTEALVDLTEKNGLIWQLKRSPWIIGMFHDLCKIDQYRHPVTGRIIDGDKYCPVYDEQTWEYNTETLLKGHGDKSVMRCASLLQLTEEEVTQIPHSCHLR